MISEVSGVIILACESTRTKDGQEYYSGFVVHVGSSQTMYNLGYYSDTWMKDFFEPYNGEVTLSNE